MALLRKNYVHLHLFVELVILYMANFNHYVDTIELDFWREFCQREGKLRSYVKGDYFLRAGETPRYFGFIVSGYFKYSVVDSCGEEHVTGFALSNNLAGDFYSAIHCDVSFNNLKAATNSTVLVVNAEKVRNMLDTHPETRLSMAEELFRMAHERYINHYRQSPKERYVALMHLCPDILQYITLKELASYLQITPTHLSRIRKEILYGE